MIKKEHKIKTISNYSVLLGLLALVGFYQTADAHHSHGNYQIGQEIQVKGTVSELLLRNPHVWVFIEVQDGNGEKVVWGLEAGGIAGFKRNGWDDIEVGDKLSVTCTPTRDGAHGCFIIDLVVDSSSETSTKSKEWIHYTDTDQLFKVNFPSEPSITQVPFLAEYGGTFPSTVYKSSRDDSHYSLTVVDYSDAKNIYLELADEINVAGAHNFWLYDQLGAIDYAAEQFRLRGGETTYDAWHHVDFIEGHQLFITNQDQTRTYAGIYRHADRLYILEATVPEDAPPQGIFQQSLTILDEQGKRVRYDLLPDHTRVRVEAD